MTVIISLDWPTQNLLCELDLHPFFVRVFFDQKVAEWVSLSRCNTNKDGTIPIFTPMGKIRSIT